MKKWLKKYWWILALVAALIAWNVYLLKNSGNLEQVKANLELENKAINEKLVTSHRNVTALTFDISGKTKEIAALDAKLTTSLEQYRTLQKQFATKPKKVVDPSTFQDLLQCQNEFSELAARFNLCTATAEKGDYTLNLSLQKSERQAETIQLQEDRFYESQELVKLTKQKLANTEAAMVNLDRYWKKKTVFKKLKSFIAGAVIGSVVVWLLKKINLTR